MHFQPPINSELTNDSTAYVAYAPSDACAATEQDQLNTLSIGFGPAMGPSPGMSARSPTRWSTSCRASHRRQNRNPDFRLVPFGFDFSRPSLDN
jgi:hypothetical protein